MSVRTRVLSAAIVSIGMMPIAWTAEAPAPAIAAPVRGPLHTTGTDSTIRDATGAEVRLTGFNWTGTELGGRADPAHTPDACGVTWRTPTDPQGRAGYTFENMYQVLRDWGYNSIRIPVSWNDLEPVAPVWSASQGQYVHAWNTAYLNDLKSMVTAASAAGLMVLLDLHQDYWSPALHRIVNWDGTAGYCEGVGMPRWLTPSIDVKASTSQEVDFLGAMNRFFRNVHDPAAVVTRATPWQLAYSVWDQLSYQFSTAAGFGAAGAVVGADLFNEPYARYVGTSPAAGETVLQAAGRRLVAFYDAIAPAITSHRPDWLLVFQDATGGYRASDPSLRETPAITSRPTTPGNWVYSIHDYAFQYGVFADGTSRHDDFGITLVNAAWANATAWHVPLYIGEFTVFGPAVDARTLVDAGTTETREFLAWTRSHGVSWSFWAYVNAYRPMTVIDIDTNQVIAVVKRALDTGR